MTRTLSLNLNKKLNFLNSSINYLFKTPLSIYININHLDLDFFLTSQLTNRDINIFDVVGDVVGGPAP